MFDYESPNPKEAPDYTGLKVVAILAPVFFLITFLSNADEGLAACIVLGMIMVAIKIRWGTAETHLVLGNHWDSLGAPHSISA